MSEITTNLHLDKGVVSLITLGLLTLHEHQESAYFTEIARRAEKFQIEVFRFTPTSIDPKTELIRGERFDTSNNCWKKAIFQIPTYLYDRCFYSLDELSKKSQPIMSWLKNRPGTLFIGYGLPNKWMLYTLLKQDATLSYYVPKTEKIHSATQVLQNLVTNERLLVKPETGAQGKGIFGMMMRKNQIELISHRQQQRISKTFTSKASFITWFKKLLAIQPYLCQPLLQLQDKNHRPFDIRILLQKNKHGRWQEQGRGVRKGKAGHLISNLSGGGEIIQYETWLHELPHRQQVVIQDEINTIINRVPILLEKYCPPLFELGIDIGVAADGSVWLLDTNSKPGRKVIIETSPSKEDDLYSAPLDYCNFLDQKSSVYSTSKSGE